jgi:hypothetical protein
MMSYRKIRGSLLGYEKVGPTDKRGRVRPIAEPRFRTIRPSKMATKPLKSSSGRIEMSPGDLEGNINIMARAMERYYGAKLPKFKVYGHGGEKEYDRAYGKPGASSSASAFVVPVYDEIHLSPEVTKIVRRGEIKNKYDFYVLKGVAHELGHSMGKTKPATETAFDEGSNEILATRFLFHNLRMPRRVREEVAREPLSTYTREVKYVGDIALMVNDGDPKRAINWLKKFKTSKYDEKMRMMQEARDKLRKEYDLTGMFWIKALNDPELSPNRYLEEKRKMEEVSAILRKYHPDWYERLGGETWWLKV